MATTDRHERRMARERRSPPPFDGDGPGATAGERFRIGPDSLLQPHALAATKLPEVASLLGEHFSPNTLRVLGAAEDFRPELRSTRFGALRVSMLSYRAAVELDVETSDDHLLVTTQLHGDESVRSQGREASGRTGFVVVDSTPERVTKRFSADSCRVSLRLDRGGLDALWRRVTASDGPAPRVFAPFVATDLGRRRWWSHLQVLLGYLEGPGGGLPQRALVERIEEAVMLFLLLEHPHDRSAVLAAPVARPTDRALDRAEAYLRDHLQQGVRLSAVAQAAGLGVRALTEGFRARHDTSPMRFAEALRLDAAHAALLARDGSVTDVATRFAFTNAGRFAAAYRVRFGVSPSRTLGAGDRSALAGGARRR